MPEAIQAWEAVLQKAPTDSKTYLKALSSIPIAYEVLKDWTAAEQSYLQMFEENEHSESLLRYKKYRHFAAKQLCDMHRRNKNWDKALQYLHWAEERYPLISNREEAYIESKVDFTLKRAEIYQAKSQPDSAILFLVTALFEKTLEPGQEDLSTPGSIGQQAPLLEAALSQIAETHNKYYFQQDLGAALDDLKLKRGPEGRTVHFELKGLEYVLQLGEQQLRKKEVVELLRQSYFFQLLKT